MNWRRLLLVMPVSFWMPLHAMAQDDPAPLAYLQHSCGEGQRMWLNVREAAEGVLQDVDALEVMIRAWRDDGGPILLRSWTTPGEHARAGFRERERHIASVVDRLKAADIWEGYIFIQRSDELRMGTGHDDDGTLIEAWLPSRGRRCLEHWGRLRLDWVERNCLGSEAKASRSECANLLSRTY